MPWNQILTSAVIAAVVAAAISAIVTVFVQGLANRHDRVRLAVDMAKLQQDYQRMMVEMATSVGQQLHVAIWNPTFELPR